MALQRERKAEELCRALTEYVGLRASVQHRMLDEDMVSIEDARAREVLRKISNGEGLEADNFVKAWGGERVTGVDCGWGPNDTLRTSQRLFCQRAG